jgi:hypothetical protein
MRHDEALLLDISDAASDVQAALSGCDLPTFKA